MGKKKKQIILESYRKIEDWIARSKNHDSQIQYQMLTRASQELKVLRQMLRKQKRIEEKLGANEK